MFSLHVRRILLIHHLPLFRHLLLLLLLLVVMRSPHWLHITWMADLRNEILLARVAGWGKGRVRSGWALLLRMLLLLLMRRVRLGSMCVHWHTSTRVIGGVG